MKKSILYTLIAMELLSTFSNLESNTKIKSILKKDYSHLEKLIERKEDTKSEIKFDPLTKIPHYKTSGENCSGYVRKAGQDLYKKNYSWTDAWNRRYVEKIIYKFKSKRELNELDSLRKNEILKPGMIIGTYVPGSQRNKTEKDWSGKKPKYTHVMLYGGKDSTNQHYFLHEWGRNQEKISYTQAKKMKLSLIEILDENLQLTTSTKKYIEKVRTYYN